MGIALSLLVGVLVVLGITVATAYFVAQEFAYMAVDRSRLAAAAEAGDASAERALAITRRTSFMLSGAQLGITVTGLLVGYVAEPLIGESLASLMGGTSHALSMAVGGAVALGFSTLVQMLFGELYPKNYAIARADWTARMLSGSTRVYLAIFGPVIWIFDRAAELFLKLLRIEPVHDVDHSATQGDLEHVIEESRVSGQLTPEMSALLDRIVDFPRRDVEHAMIPRARVGVVRADDTIGEVRELMATGHTRYPVLDDQDHIVGVAHLVDVLGHPPDAAEPIAALAREALVLPLSMSLTDALASLRAHGEYLACVIDEYGGFDGVITAEDLAEEVVGEITDEHDPYAVPDLPSDIEGPWEVPGDTPIDEVERALLIDLPVTDNETIAGLVVEVFGALPGPGEVVEIPVPLDTADRVTHPEEPEHLLRAEVLAVENYVPARLLLTLEIDGAGGDGGTRHTTGGVADAASAADEGER